MKLFVLRDGHQTGPFTPEQVQELLLREYFKPSDLAWHEELVAWQALSFVLPDLLAPVLPSVRRRNTRPPSGDWLPPLTFEEGDLDLSPPPPPHNHRRDDSNGTRSIPVTSPRRQVGESATPHIPPSAVWSLRFAIFGMAFHPLLFLSAGLVLPVPPIHLGVILLGFSTLLLLSMNMAGMLMAAFCVYSERTRSTTAVAAMFLHAIQLAVMGVLLGIGMIMINQTHDIR